MKKNKGLFTYEYEETVLLLSRIGKLKKMLNRMKEVLKDILRKDRGIDSFVKDRLEQLENMREDREDE